MCFYFPPKNRASLAQNPTFGGVTVGVDTVVLADGAATAWFSDVDVVSGLAIVLFPLSVRVYFTGFSEVLFTYPAFISQLR